jgi:hypothetical protein
MLRRHVVVARTSTVPSPSGVSVTSTRVDPGGSDPAGGVGLPPEGEHQPARWVEFDEVPTHHGPVPHHDAEQPARLGHDLGVGRPPPGETLRIGPEGRAISTSLMGSCLAQGRPPPRGAEGLHRGPPCGEASGPGPLLGLGAIPAASPLACPTSATAGGVGSCPGRAASGATKKVEAPLNRASRLTCSPGSALALGSNV